jgi:hypothetical protein
LLETFAPLFSLLRKSEAPAASSCVVLHSSNLLIGGERAADWSATRGLADMFVGRGGTPLGDTFAKDVEAGQPVA